MGWSIDVNSAFGAVWGWWGASLVLMGCAVLVRQIIAVVDVRPCAAGFDGTWRMPSTAMHPLWCWVLSTRFCRHLCYCRMWFVPGVALIDFA